MADLARTLRRLGLLKGGGDAHTVLLALTPQQRQQVGANIATLIKASDSPERLLRILLALDPAERRHVDSVLLDESLTAMAAPSPGAGKPADELL